MTRKRVYSLVMLLCFGIFMTMGLKVSADVGIFSAEDAGYNETTVTVLNKKTYKAKKLTSKQYKAIKGWWSQNSSGGYNIKFTKSGKICYYDRYSDKRADYDVIYKMKKSKSGYILYLYNNDKGYKYRYKLTGDNMEYYIGWKGNSYSGSSSLFRGKW